MVDNKKQENSQLSAELQLFYVKDDDAYTGDYWIRMMMQYRRLLLRNEIFISSKTNFPG